MVVNVLPTFAAIYGAMTISNMSDVQCVMTGLIIGAAWGVAAFFFDIGSAFTMKYEKIEDGVDEAGNPKYKEQLVPAGTVNLKVTVDDEQIESKTVSEDAKNVVVTIDGTGSVEVKVYINETRKSRVNFNFNTDRNLEIK